MQKHKQPQLEKLNITVAVTFTETNPEAFSIAFSNNRIRTFFVKGSANG